MAGSGGEGEVGQRKRHAPHQIPEAGAHYPHGKITRTGENGIAHHRMGIGKQERQAGNFEF